MTLSRRIALFALFSACLLAGTFGVWRALFEFARRDDTASHVVLIPFVTAALIFQRRESLFASARWAPGGIAVISAGLLLLMSGGLQGVAHPVDGSLTVMVAGAVTAWLGGVLLFFGPETFRGELFPLLFLGFLIPFPASVVDRATHLLKTGSADVVEGLFTLTRTPYYREGFRFSLPSFVIEIADECSGIHSSIALLLTSLLAGHVFLRSGWKKAIVLLAVFPLALLKNAIRIVSLTLLAMYVNPSFLTGQLHHEGGIVFFLLALALVTPLFTLLRNSEPSILKGQTQQ
jgi:exosortase